GLQAAGDFAGLVDPCDLELLDIGFVDAVERAVPARFGIAVIDRPVCRIIVCCRGDTGRGQCCDERASGGSKRSSGPLSGVAGETRRAARALVRSKEFHGILLLETRKTCFFDSPCGASVRAVLRLQAPA